MVSSVGWYRSVYAAFGWMCPVLEKAFPGAVMTSSILGRALLVAARHGAPKRVLEAADINALVPRAPT